jgi:hypothetical protein
MQQGKNWRRGDEDWIIVRVTDDEMQLNEASVLGFTTKLGLDAIASFTTDRSRSISGGLQYGLLLLKVQMYVQSDVITYAPCTRPGERVAPLLRHLKPQTAADQIAHLANEQAYVQDTEILATSREAHRAVEENLAALFDHIQRTIANLGSQGLKGEVGHFAPGNIGVKPRFDWRLFTLRQPIGASYRWKTHHSILRCSGSDARTDDAQ